MVVEGVFLDLAKISLSNPMVQSLGIAVVRSVAGWLENALENGHIDKFEVKKLFETMFRVIPQALGLTALVGPIGVVGTLFTDYLISKVTHAFGKKK